MAIGYSLKVLKSNNAADPNHVGVRLGRACIDNDIPVVLVADRFGITRQTVYNWFVGTSMPPSEKVGAINRFIADLDSEAEAL